MQLEPKSGTMTHLIVLALALILCVATVQAASVSYLRKTMYNDIDCSKIVSESMFTYGYCQPYQDSTDTSAYVVISIVAGSSNTATTMRRYSDSSCTVTTGSTTETIETFVTGVCISESGSGFVNTYVRYDVAFPASSGQVTKAPPSLLLNSGADDIAAFNMYLTAGGCNSKDKSKLIYNKKMIANTCFDGGSYYSMVGGGGYTEITCSAGDSETYDDDASNNNDVIIDLAFGANVEGAYYPTSNCVFDVTPIAQDDFPTNVGTCSYVAVGIYSGYVNTSCSESSLASKIWKIIGNWALALFCGACFIAVLLYLRAQNANSSAAAANGAAATAAATTPNPVVMVYSGQQPQQPQMQMYPPAPAPYPMQAPVMQQAYPPAPQAYPSAPQAYPPAPQAYPPAPQAYAVNGGLPPPPPY